MAKDVPSATTNGAAPHGGNRGPLSPAFRPRESARLARSWLRKLRVHSVPVDPEFFQAIRDTAESCMQAEEPRVQVAGLKAAVAIAQYNLSVAETVDKMARLDEGKPTENVDHRVFTFEFDRKG